MRRYSGPLTEGLTLPANLDLGVRDKALEQLGVRPAVHARIVSTVKDVLGERDGGLLVGARPWPLLAARMQQIGKDHGPKAVADHLARLTGDDSWRVGAPGEFARRMVLSTHQALTTPPRRTSGGDARGLGGRSPLPLHHHARRGGARPGRSDRSRGARPPAGRLARQGDRPRTVTAGTPLERGRRAIWAWTDRVRAAWWALSGRDRIAVEGLLLSGALLAAAWRAGHLGLVQADFVLSVLGGTAGVATLCRGAVWRPQPAAPMARPLVASSEEVQRHVAREAGTVPGA
ncbi:hypothetical protein [Streptomyces sp. NPDC059957]|uniref:hypothetical protein n=1 Tax=unclassified Streptomyces TaxID=2593676 RepID=UPI00364E1C61